MKLIVVPWTYDTTCRRPAESRWWRLYPRVMWNDSILLVQDRPVPAFTACQRHDTRPPWMNLQRHPLGQITLPAAGALLPSRSRLTRRLSSARNSYYGLPILMCTCGFEAPQDFALRSAQRTTTSLCASEPYRQFSRTQTVIRIKVLGRPRESRDIYPDISILSECRYRFEHGNAYCTRCPMSTSGMNPRVHITAKISLT